MASVASEICPVRGVWLSCGRHAVQFKMLPQTTRRRQLQARVHLADRASVDVLPSWIGSLSSCARRDPPSWLLSRAAPILLKGPSPLDTLPRCSALSWGWWCGGSVRAHRLLQRTSFSDSSWRLRRVGCSAANDVHGLAALDDRAPDEMHGFVAHDGDAGTTGHCASVALGGLPPSVAMAVTTSRPKADTLRDADPRDGGAKPKVGRRAASR